MRFEGFDVVAASSSAETLTLAEEHGPNLVVVDVETPDLGGFELCRRIRRGSRTRSIPVILLGERPSTQDQVAGFEAGADDYLGKPLEPAEFVARVTRSLSRSRAMRAVNPLTNLPGNVEILQELTRRIWDKEPTALLYIDLDNFKAFNDYHGFLRGDAALKVLASCVTDVVGHRANTLVGHIGGDDFAVILDPAVAEVVAHQVVQSWDARMPLLYSPEDVARGYIEVLDRRKRPQKYALLSVSVGIATTERRPISSPFEFAHLAAEMKQVAKRDAVSSVALDRRRI